MTHVPARLALCFLTALALLLLSACEPRLEGHNPNNISGPPTAAADEVLIEVQFGMATGCAIHVRDAAGAKGDFTLPKEQPQALALLKPYAARGLTLKLMAKDNRQLIEACAMAVVDLGNAAGFSKTASYM